jgi:hypothetical protein
MLSASGICIGSGLVQVKSVLLQVCTGEGQIIPLI